MGLFLAPPLASLDKSVAALPAYSQKAIVTALRNVTNSGSLFSASALLYSCNSSYFPGELPAKVYTLKSRAGWFLQESPTYASRCFVKLCTLRQKT
eukprot:6372790-Amphidinium_carterae.1